MIDNLLERWIPRNGKGSHFVQIYAIFVVSLGGFTIGAHFAWTSPAIPELISNSSYIGQITIEQASYFAIISPVVMFISSLICPLLMNIVGRKYVIGFMPIPHIISWILIGTAKSIIPLYIAKALTGIADAITYCIIPVYIAEITSPSVRGKWGNMLMCAIFLGHVAISVVDNICGITTTAFIFLIAPLLQIGLIIFLPESPYYLIMINNDDKAKRVLKQLLWKEEAVLEFDSLAKDVHKQLSKSSTFMDLFTISTNRKALLICLTLRVCQQLTGITAFTVYAEYMFHLADIDSIPVELTSVIFFSALFIFSTLFSSVGNRYGRKSMLTFSSFGCTIALLLEAIYFYLMDKTEIDVSQVNWIPLAGMIGYIVVFTVGLSFLPTLMTGELFSASIKNYAMLILTTFLAFTIIFVPKLFQLLLSNFDLYIPFLIFSICSLVSTIFCYYCVPETKGKTLEEIQILLSQS